MYVQMTYAVDPGVGKVLARRLLTSRFYVHVGNPLFTKTLRGSPYYRFWRGVKVRCKS